MLSLGIRILNSCETMSFTLKSIWENMITSLICNVLTKMGVCQNVLSVTDDKVVRYTFVRIFY